MSALFLSVSYLGNEPVELVLLVGGVEGDRLHAHGLAVLPGLVLLKVTAAKLPGHHEALALPEVVRSLGGTLGGASSDAEMIEVIIRGHEVIMTHVLEDPEEKLGWADCLTGWAGCGLKAGACWKLP